MLGLLALLLGPPVAADVSADRLEVYDGGWRAEGGLRVETGEWRLEGAAAAGAPTGECPQGRIAVEGPARLTLRNDLATALAARRLTLCLPGPTGAAEDLSVRTPRWRLTAASATLRDDRLLATEVTATGCACDEPPWRVTARAAEVTPGEGAWAEWPVLWAGPVPVAAAPRWYVPFARRRTGFLLPELGWDGEDGPFGRVPFFWAPHQSLDLTLAPGARAHFGPTAAGRLRWAADDDEGGTLAVDSVVPDGAVAWGEGSVAAGPARLAIAGEAATAQDVRQALRPGLASRGRDHLRTRAALTVGADALQVGVGGALLQDLRGGGDLLGQPGVYQPAPEIWLAWTAPLPFADLRIDARFSRFDAAAAPVEERAALDAGLDATWWLGPLRLRPDASLLTQRLDDGGRLVGAAGLEAAVGVARDFEGLRHEIWLAARGRRVGVDERGEPAILDAEDRPLPSRRGELAAQTRLVGGSVSGSVEVSLGYEAEAPVEGREAPVASAAVDAAHAGVEAVAALDEAVRARARLGAAAGPRLDVGYARLRPEPSTPIFVRQWTRGIPRLFLVDGDDVDTIDGRVTLPWGRLEATYGLVADAADAAVLGQDAGFGWRGGCDCWSARLRASHERGRDAPDVWLEVALAPSP